MGSQVRVVGSAWVGNLGRRNTEPALRADLPAALHVHTGCGACEGECNRKPASSDGWFKKTDSALKYIFNLGSRPAWYQGNQSTKKPAREITAAKRRAQVHSREGSSNKAGLVLQELGGIKSVGFLGGPPLVDAPNVGMDIFLVGIRL